MNRTQAGEDSNPVVFCDFDGTITQLDVTDQILAQLAHPSWREIEQEWMLGLIGSRECLERQIALVDAPAEELHAVIDAVAIDARLRGLLQVRAQEAAAALHPQRRFRLRDSPRLEGRRRWTGIFAVVRTCLPARCGWRAAGWCLPFPTHRNPARTAAPPAKPR